MFLHKCMLKKMRQNSATCFDIVLSFQKDKYEYWKLSFTENPSLEACFA